jgi:hypothetical protein
MNFVLSKPYLMIMQYQFSSSKLAEIELSCPKCNWQGKGEKAVKEELFLTEAIELYCPECHHYFGFISTSEEDHQ